MLLNKSSDQSPIFRLLDKRVPRPGRYESFASKHVWFVRLM